MMLVQRLQRLCSPSRKRRGCSVTLQVIFRRSPDRGRQPQKVYRRRSSGSKTFSPRYYSNRSILWADSKKAVGRPRVCAILSVTTPESPAVPTDRAVAMPKKKNSCDSKRLVFSHPQLRALVAYSDPVEWLAGDPTATRKGYPYFR